MYYHDVVPQSYSWPMSIYIYTSPTDTNYGTQYSQYVSTSEKNAAHYVASYIRMLV